MDLEPDPEANAAKNPDLNVPNYRFLHQNMH